MKKDETKYICSNCGTLLNSKPKKATKWSFGMVIFVDLILIILFIFCYPLALLALVIMFFTAVLTDKKIVVCPSCQAENSLVPIDTPRGQKLVKEFDT